MDVKKDILFKIYHILNVTIALYLYIYNRVLENSL